MGRVVTFGYDKRFNNKIKNRLKNMKIDRKFIKLNEFGQMGVDALQAATPVLTGKTANSWYYEISEENGKTSLIWYNTNVNNGLNIAVLVDTGHASADGSWVMGWNYIYNAINPVIEKINKYFKEDVIAYVASEPYVGEINS